MPWKRGEMDSAVEVIPRGMRAALRAARRGEGRVSPNPLVGAAVEIPGGGLVVAHHARFGGPHAEAALLARAVTGTTLPAGSTLYVTLEPCSHAAKTPPCVDRVIKARPQRVVVAAVDPDPRVSGQGIALLRQAGIDVSVGPGEDAALAQNLPFHLRHRLGRAQVRLKLATTLDGRLGSPVGRERRITGEIAERAVHRERAASDAILVGSGTMAADDPLLTVRAVRSPDPSRIVVDSDLRTAARCRAWRAWRETAVPDAAAAGAGAREGNYHLVDARPGPRWVRRARLILATRRGHAGRRLDEYRRIGWEIWELPTRTHGSSGEESVSLAALAARAAREGFLRLLVEAGPRLAGAFFASGLVDELSLYQAPMVVGGSLAWPAGWMARGIARAVRFEPVGEAKLGADRYLLYRRAGLLELVRWEACGRPAGAQPGSRATGRALFVPGDRKLCLPG